MTVESNKENPSQSKDLEYARDVFVQLFQTEAPLINLGYTSKQREITKPVLKLMENEAEVRSNPLEAYFHGPNESCVVMWKLKRNGFMMVADREGHPDLFTEYASSGGFFEDSLSTRVAMVNLLPDNDYSNIHTLVSHLYEGQLDGDVKLEPLGLISNLKTKFLANTAVYQAAWVDDETKLELIVESNFTDKSLGDDFESEIHIWRRLPAQTKDGKKWIPFGRKPSISNDKLKKILESKKERTFAGQLIPATNNI